MDYQYTLHFNKFFNYMIVLRLDQNCLLVVLVIYWCSKSFDSTSKTVNFGFFVYAMDGIL